MKNFIFGLIAISSSSLYANTDFEALYKKASAPAENKKIIIADNFENGVSPEVKKVLNCKDSSGTAGISVSSETKTSGSNSLMIKSSTTVEHGFMPALSFWYKNQNVISSGTININFDFMIPSQGKGILIVEARDYTSTKEVAHFRSTLTHQGFRLGETSKGYKQDSWHHCEITVPVKQNNTQISMTVTSKDGIQRQIDFPSKSAEKISWIGLFLMGKQDNHIFMDNLVISHKK